MDDVDWKQALTKVGLWGLREANLTLKTLDSTLDAVQKESNDFIEDIKPLKQEQKKTYLVNYPKIDKKKGDEEMLRKYINEFINDVETYVIITMLITMYGNGYVHFNITLFLDLVTS